MALLLLAQEWHERNCWRFLLLVSMTFVTIFLVETLMNDVPKGRSGTVTNCPSVCFASNRNLRFVLPARHTSNTNGLVCVCVCVYLAIAFRKYLPKSIVLLERHPLVPAGELYSYNSIKLAQCQHTQTHPRSSLAFANWLFDYIMFQLRLGSWCLRRKVVVGLDDGLPIYTHYRVLCDVSAANGSMINAVVHCVLFLESISLLSRCFENKTKNTWFWLRTARLEIAAAVAVMQLKMSETCLSCHRGFCCSCTWSSHGIAEIRRRSLSSNAIFADKRVRVASTEDALRWRVFTYFYSTFLKLLIDKRAYIYFQI